jgi:hypothetical protein
VDHAFGRRLIEALGDRRQQPLGLLPLLLGHEGADPFGERLEL